jgi:hypothetical protein
LPLYDVNNTEQVVPCGIVTQCSLVLVYTSIEGGASDMRATIIALVSALPSAGADAGKVITGTGLSLKGTDVTLLPDGSAEA